jgi:hypothetical protein
MPIWVLSNLVKITVAMLVIAVASWMLLRWR